jgi:hypothetical protein
MNQKMDPTTFIFLISETLIYNNPFLKLNY